MFVTSFRLVWILAAISPCLGMEPCRQFGSDDKPALEIFVKQWYKLPPNQTVTLIDSATVDSSCYRKLTFRASVPAPLLTLYLTPDGKHLVTGVMDLTVDPVLARRQKQDELEAQLTAGALLTSVPSTAPLKMVVFSDFQCPYCKRFAGFLNGLTPEERGKLQITYRQLPLPMHPWAQDAAALSVCVALQDKTAFWKLHDFLFANQQELTKETITAKALEFLSQDKAVDSNKVTSCLSEKGFEPSLQRDQQLATDLGIQGTPTVFLEARRISVKSVEDLRKALRTAEVESAPIAGAYPVR